jgi:hypothetical protein
MGVPRPDADAHPGVIRLVLWLYALGCVFVAIPLAFAIGMSGDLGGTTSGKVLAGALVVLAYGAARAAADPWRHRVIVQMLVLFAALASVAVLYRLVFEGHAIVPAALVLAASIAATVLLVVFFPRGPAQ